MTSAALAVADQQRENDILHRGGRQYATAGGAAFRPRLRAELRIAN